MGESRRPCERNHCLGVPCLLDPFRGSGASVAAVGALTPSASAVPGGPSLTDWVKSRLSDHSEQQANSRKSTFSRDWALAGGSENSVRGPAWRNSGRFRSEAKINCCRKWAVFNHTAQHAGSHIAPAQRQTFHFVVIVESQDLPLPLARLGCHQPPAKGTACPDMGHCSTAQVPRFSRVPWAVAVFATCPQHHCRRARKSNEVTLFFSCGMIV